jgi:5'-nucleotidase
MFNYLWVKTGRLEYGFSVMNYVYKPMRGCAANQPSNLGRGVPNYPNIIEKVRLDYPMYRYVLVLMVLLVIVPIANAANYNLVTLLHTNDLHGQVMLGDQSGLAKIASLVRQIRADMPNVVLFDGGDMIHGTYEDFFSGGMAIISAMNATGYNSVVAGNHEFDFGLPALRQDVSAATFPILAANVKSRATGQIWSNLQPYVIVNVGEVKLGVLGITTTQVVDLQWPGSITDIRVDDPVETAKTLIPELRKNADVIVVLSHLGYDNDRKLAAAVQGIDFIVGGHSHTVLDKWNWVGDTLIMQTGAYGRYLGRIDFIVSTDATGAKIISVNGKNGRLWNDLQSPPLSKIYPTSPLIPITAAISDDQEVVTAYMPYHERAEALLGEVIGKAKETITVVPAPSGESPAGNLAADAIRAAAKSDIAVVDSNSIITGLDIGEIKLRNAFDMVGGFTRQQLVVVRMKGSELLTILSTELLRGKSLKLQISGATFNYSINKSDKPKISNLKIGGVPVDPTKDYTISGQAYVIQGFMTGSSSVSVVAELLLTTREAIANYIRAVNIVKSPETDRIIKL